MSMEESKDEPAGDSLSGSDLDKWFSVVAAEEKDKEKAAAQVQKKDEASGDEFTATMSDLAKGSANFKLIETNGKESVANYANVDWTQNKKVYK